MRGAHVPQRREHNPGVAQLESGQQQRRGQLPRLRSEGDRGEDDRLHHGAADDDGAPADLVRPHAPEGNQEDTDHEDQRREDACEGCDIALREADLAKARGEKGEDLADPDRLDQ
jgi:hypothetical protein